MKSSSTEDVEAAAARSCRLCDHVAASAGGLRRHLRERHAGAEHRAEFFVCHRCERTEEELAAMKAHITADHNGVGTTHMETVYRCSAPGCGQQTAGWTELSRHLRSAHPLQCALCPFSTAQDSVLGAHLRQRHGGAELPPAEQQLAGHLQKEEVGAGGIERLHEMESAVTGPALAERVSTSQSSDEDATAVAGANKKASQESCKRKTLVLGNLENLTLPKTKRPRRVLQKNDRPLLANKNFESDNRATGFRKESNLNRLSTPSDTSSVHQSKENRMCQRATSNYSSLKSSKGNRVRQCVTSDESSQNSSKENYVSLCQCVTSDESSQNSSKENHVRQCVTSDESSQKSSKKNNVYESVTSEESSKENRVSQCAASDESSKENRVRQCVTSDESSKENRLQQFAALDKSSKENRISQCVTFNESSKGNRVRQWLTSDKRSKKSSKENSVGQCNTSDETSQKSSKGNRVRQCVTSKESSEKSSKETLVGQCVTSDESSKENRVRESVTSDESSKKSCKENCVCQCAASDESTATRREKTKVYDHTATCSRYSRELICSEEKENSSLNGRSPVPGTQVRRSSSPDVVLYKCELCDYVTTRSVNYRTHIGKRHQLAVGQVQLKVEEINDSFIDAVADLEDCRCDPNRNFAGKEANRNLEERAARSNPAAERGSSTTTDVDHSKDCTNLPKSPEQRLNVDQSESEEKQQNDPETSQETWEAFFCDQCPFKTGSTALYREHVEGVHNEMVIRCGNCEYMSTQLDTIKKHHRAVHKLKPRNEESAREAGRLSRGPFSGSLANTSACDGAAAVGSEGAALDRLGNTDEGTDNADDGKKDQSKPMPTKNRPSGSSEKEKRKHKGSSSSGSGHKDVEESAAEKDVFSCESCSFKSYLRFKMNRHTAKHHSEVTERREAVVWGKQRRKVREVFITAQSVYVRQSGRCNSCELSTRCKKAVAESTLTTSSKPGSTSSSRSVYWNTRNDIMTECKGADVGGAEKDVYAAVEDVTKIEDFSVEGIEIDDAEQDIIDVDNLELDAVELEDIGTGV